MLPIRSLDGRTLTLTVVTDHRDAQIDTTDGAPGGLLANRVAALAVGRIITESNGVPIDPMDGAKSDATHGYAVLSNDLTAYDLVGCTSVRLLKQAPLSQKTVQGVSCRRVNRPAVPNVPRLLEESNELARRISEGLLLVLSLQRLLELPTGPFVVAENDISLEKLAQRLLQIADFAALHLGLQWEGDVVHGLVAPPWSLASRRSGALPPGVRKKWTLAAGFIVVPNFARWHVASNVLGHRITLRIWRHPLPAANCEQEQRTPRKGLG